MNNELKRILKMVEEGKISAEDAARLIEALSSGRKKPEGIFTILEEVGDRIKGLKGFGAKRSYKFKRKNSLDLKGLTGNIRVISRDGDTITISCNGFARVDESGTGVRAKIMSGDIEVAVPKKIKLSIGSASGDINIDGVDGELNLKAAAGDITIRDFGGSFDIAGAFSDLDLDIARFEGGRIKAAFGDIKVGLNPDDDIVVEVNLKKGGTIKNDADLKVIDEGKGFLRATMNRGKNRLAIEGVGGSVTFKRR